MSNTQSSHVVEDTTYEVAERVRARLEVWNTGTLAWDRMTQPGAGAGGGGPVTIVDGGDVAQGATSDIAWVSGSGTLIAISKAAFAKLEAIRAQLAASIVVTGPLTDTQLRASAVPVSFAEPFVKLDTAAGLAGSSGNPIFVSGPLTDTQLRASAVPVSLASVPSHAVTNAGTFAVQSAATLAAETTKVIGTVNLSAGQTLATLTGITNVVHVDDNAASLTVDAPVGTPVFARLSDGAAVLIGQKAMASSLPVVLASDQASIPVAATLAAETTKVIGTVNPPAITKGTQGANGFTVQNLNDAGRNTRIFMLDAITAAPLVEAVQTVVQWYGNAAVAGTAQPAVVPAGKTLRLTGYKIQYQSLATVGYAVVRIRANTTGLGVLGSPLVASFEAGSGSGATTVAMTGGVTTETGTFEEGLELPAGTGLAFSMAGYGPTGALTLEGGTRFQVIGYEY